LYTRKVQNSARVDMPRDLQMLLLDVAFMTLLMQRLGQLYPTRGPHAAHRPSRRFCAAHFRCSKSILHTDNLSLFRCSWFSHFWCRWYPEPLYRVCYHCS